MEPREFARLVNSYGAALVLYARQWSPAPEDAVQDAFIRLATLGQAPSNAVAWLYKTVRHAAIDAGKAARRRQRREAAVARPEPWFREPGIEELDAATAVAALQRLPDDEREVIVARLWGGLSFEDIGEVAGCSASTAFRRYAAGIETLRKELGESCPTRSPNA